jgi:hypothetical protein
MLRFPLAVAALSLAAPRALAGDDPFADRVIAFVQGEGGNPSYANPATTLGPPERYTGEGVFPGVVSPFNPAFGTDEIVSLGAGGTLTVAFDTPILDDPMNPHGIDLLVFGNAFFIDDAFPEGVVGGLFGNGGQIEVSADGDTWVVWRGAEAVGLFPTLGYLDAGPYALEAGTIETSFTRPVDPALDLAGLLGLEYAELIDLYAGSGGGTGIDLAGLGLDAIGFVRVTNPSDALAPIAIDAFSDVAPLVPPVPGDVNGDSVVNVQDLTLIITAWGAAPPGEPADLNGDGVVDVQDLIEVITQWS